MRDSLPLAVVLFLAIVAAGAVLNWAYARQAAPVVGVLYATGVRT